MKDSSEQGRGGGGCGKGSGEVCLVVDVWFVC